VRHIWSRVALSHDVTINAQHPACASACDRLRLRCRGLIRATLHLVNREFASLADDFMTLGLLPPGSDKDTIVPALTGVFQVHKHAPCVLLVPAEASAVGTVCPAAAGMHVSLPQRPDGARICAQEALANGVSNISFGDLSGNLGRTMYQYNFQIPAYYTLLVRLPDLIFRCLQIPQIYTPAVLMPLPHVVAGPESVGLGGHRPGQRPQLQGPGRHVPLDCQTAAHGSLARAEGAHTLASCLQGAGMVFDSAAVAIAVLCALKYFRPAGT